MGLRPSPVREDTNADPRPGGWSDGPAPRDTGQEGQACAHTRVCGQGLFIRPAPEGP